MCRYQISIQRVIRFHTNLAYKYTYIIVTVLVLLILVFMKSTPIFNIDMCIFRNHSKPPNEHVVIDDTGPI